MDNETLSDLIKGELAYIPQEPEFPEDWELDLPECLDPRPKTVTIFPKRKTSWTLAELLEAEFPEPNWIVPGIIQEGLVMLAGRPKVGKSFMLLQLAGAVSSGGRFFDKEIVQGEVLYFALEDNPRRIKERAVMMGLGSAPIDFEFETRPLNAGGLDDLLLRLESKPYRLVIIDTLARALPGVKLNDENPAGVIMDRLQSLAINRGMTILLSHHTRKPNGIYADPIDDIMGSTALSRALDAVLGIYKQQRTGNAELKGRGRDTEELDLKIQFDHITACWQCLGSTYEVDTSEARQSIRGYLEDVGKSQLSTIARELGKDKSNIYKQLQGLVNEGKIKKEVIEGKAYYETC